MAAAVSPNGPELIFHDPLRDSAPASPPEPEQPVLSRVPAVSHHREPGLKSPKRRPATRADRLEAVARELILLARDRGKAAG